jgi:antitoxin (DNA-binding transcriptional repressor) of toxin-antitoxin stability system
MLGSDSSREPLDEIVRQAGSDEVEIVDKNGEIVAYLVPAPQPGDEVYAAFEREFLGDAEELRRRQASKVPGRSTRELLEAVAAGCSLSPLGRGLG